MHTARAPKASALRTSVPRRNPKQPSRGSANAFWPSRPGRRRSRTLVKASGRADGRKYDWRLPFDAEQLHAGIGMRDADEAARPEIVFRENSRFARTAVSPSMPEARKPKCAGGMACRATGSKSRTLMASFGLAIRCCRLNGAHTMGSAPAGCTGISAASASQAGNAQTGLVARNCKKRRREWRCSSFVDTPPPRIRLFRKRHAGFAGSELAPTRKRA